MTLLLVEIERFFLLQAADDIGANRMARDYVNLPALLDALESEMDLESAALASEARAAQERGLIEMKRSRVAIKGKNAVIDRMRAFNDAMEARNGSNGDPTPSRSDGSPGSSVQASPAENAGLAEVT